MKALLLLCASALSLALNGALAAPSGMLYTANERGQSISQIDLGKGQVKTFAVGLAPHNLQVSADGRWLKSIAQLMVGQAPVQVGFAADGRQAYVSLSGENALGIIDTATRQLTGKVAVGRTPVQMYATPDGAQVYVANQGSAAQPDERVSVVDPHSRQVLVTLVTGKGAHGVAISSDGAYVFVSNMLADSVSVIDTAARQVIATYPVGAGPNGISYQNTTTP